MAHGLFTDAVTRFNKGQSPLQNDRVLAHTMQWLTKHASAEVAGEIVDDKYKLPHLDALKIDSNFINERLGTELSDKEIAKLLANVEFTVHTTEDIQVTAPFWRTDIEIKEDIVEEVGRLYGYDHLPKELPKRSTKPPARNKMLDLKSEIRQVLSSAGANELLTYSFVHGKLLENVGQYVKQAFKISNALSPDLQYYRLSLTPSLLEKVHPNIKAGNDKFVLYELNKTHSKDQIDKQDKLPIEEARLALITAYSKPSKGSGAAYYEAKVYLEHLLHHMGINVVYEPSTTHDPKLTAGKQVLAPFERARTAYIKTTNGELIGIIGEYNNNARKALKLPEYCAGFELNVEQLLQWKKDTQYRPLSKFPSTEQDITFKVKDTQTYAELVTVLEEGLTTAREKQGYNSNLKPLDIYQDNKAKHITVRLVLQHSERTLVTQEVNKLIEELAKLAKAKLDAKQV